MDVQWTDNEGQYCIWIHITQVGEIFTRHNPYYEVNVKQESNISGISLLVQFGR